MHRELSRKADHFASGFAGPDSRITTSNDSAATKSSARYGVVSARPAAMGAAIPAWKVGGIDAVQRCRKALGSSGIDAQSKLLDGHQATGGRLIGTKNRPEHAGADL